MISKLTPFMFISRREALERIAFMVSLYLRCGRIGEWVRGGMAADFPINIYQKND